MTQKERVLRTVHHQKPDYLPSQITLADRTRDRELHAMLKLPADVTMDDYLENHLIISLAKKGYPLFFRNDTKMMRELEKEDYCPVDEAGKVVYDSWSMGVRVGEDGFFACFHPLEKKLDRKFAEKWLPPRIWDAVTADTLEERVRKAGNFEWSRRDLKTFGDEYFVFASGYFGLYERAYGLLSIPTMFESVLLQPTVVEEVLEKITDYKIAMAKEFVKLPFQAGHVGDDLGTQVGPFVPPDVFMKLLKPQYKRLFQVYKDGGMLMMMHSCGCITKFLPDLVEIGLDVLEPVQPCMDLEFIKKEYGEDLTFCRPASSGCWARGGGHIIAPSQEVMKGVPLENIVALVETIVEERARAF